MELKPTWRVILFEWEGQPEETATVCSEPDAKGMLIVRLDKEFRMHPEGDDGLRELHESQIKEVTFKTV